MADNKLYIPTVDKDGKRRDIEVESQEEYDNALKEMKETQSSTGDEYGWHGVKLWTEEPQTKTSSPVTPVTPTVADVNIKTPEVDDATKKNGVATLNSAQAGETNQASTGTSNQTTRKEYDKDAATAQLTDNPFLKDINDNGARAALNKLIDAGIVKKPDTKDMEQAKRDEEVQKKVGVLTESLRLLSDIGFAHAGGDVYQRDALDFTKAEAKTAKERDAYQKAMDDWRQRYIDADKDDRLRRNGILDKILDNSYKQVTDSTQSQQSQSKTGQKSAAQQFVPKQTSGNGGEGGTGSNNEWLLTTVDSKTGEPKRRFVSIPKSREEATVNAICRELARADKEGNDVIKAIAADYNVEEDVIRDILMSEKSYGKLNRKAIAQNEWARTEEAKKIFAKAVGLELPEVEKLYRVDNEQGTGYHYQRENPNKKKESETDKTKTESDDGSNNWFKAGGK